LDGEIFNQRLTEMGRLGVRSLMFAGEGEPLLHPGLAGWVRTAKASGIDVSITTNGALGAAELWRQLLPDLTWTRFSVDAGSARVYARVHQVAATAFDKTLASIASAVEIKRAHNLPVTLGIQYLLLEENLDDLENAIRLFSRIGLDYLSLKPFSYHPQMQKEKDICYTSDIIDKVSHLVERYQAQNTMRIIFRKEGVLAYRDQALRFQHCYALPFWGYISSLGDFYTCSVFLGDGRFRAGNIYQETMQDLFDGSARRESIDFGAHELELAHECRINCRMARVNEFLEFLTHKPEHINFI
jgi:MoaA/NifB/PqqE/SkfB family radical SAM enzyme